MTAPNHSRRWDAEAPAPFTNDTMFLLWLQLDMTKMCAVWGLSLSVCVYLDQWSFLISTNPTVTPVTLSEHGAPPDIIGINESKVIRRQVMRCSTHLYSSPHVAASCHKCCIIFWLWRFLLSRISPLKTLQLHFKRIHSTENRCLISWGEFWWSKQQLQTQNPCN